jgi:glycosyltransferase involved in cell wall biosynthesis
MSNYERSPTGKSESLGVTIAVCCHNSEKLLPATLAHIKNQQVSTDMKWEVLVIDNASTDKTATLAPVLWGDDGPVPLRVVSESRLGLSYARERAFSEAQYEIVSFIDDDNWINPEWIRVVIECMSAEPDLGAIASVNTSVADVPLPDWFSRYCHLYAAWADRESATPPPWILNGAGMTIRKSSWDELRQNGFKLQLTDRVGTRLSSSGDLEIGCALHLAGWKIRIERRLRLQHYMTARRLDWSYLRRLLHSIGESDALLEAYLVPFQTGMNPLSRLRQFWWFQVVKRGLRLLYTYSWITLIECMFRGMEGVDEVIEIERDMGYLLGLLRLRSRYAKVRQEIAAAPWRQLDSLFEPSQV